MKILYAASEGVPFIKSGGLADVAGSLCKALRSKGHACRVVLPLYEEIPPEYREKMKYLCHFNVVLAWRNLYCGVFEATVGGVKYYFLDNEYYFKRRGLYGFFDDAERFAFFSRAVVEMLHYIDFEPQILHCNDWQTALVPVYLDVFYRLGDRHKSLKTVLTIHNIQYQGTFDFAVTKDILGLPPSSQGIVEYRGDCNYMKGGIEQCDAITTVSPTYARELLDPWFAHGLDKLLGEKRHKLRGILNGIDKRLYDPAKDMALPQRYTAAKPEGKAVCKQELQKLMGLKEDSQAPVVGVVSRLVGHKGMDLVQFAFPRLMEAGVEFVLLGSGDWQYEKFFREMVSLYPGRVGVRLGFDDSLARQIYSGADLFLMPSRSEPCGLSQMIAMRYGTPPVARAIGGLADSVRDFGGEQGNGYTFLSYNADDMLAALYRALEDFANPVLWGERRKAAMACDFGWAHSADEYTALYQELAGT